MNNLSPYIREREPEDVSTPWQLRWGGEEECVQMRMPCP
jgi:hypothetical protein